MPTPQESQNKKETIKTPPEVGAKITIMPQEFRKAPPKKRISKKVLIIGGGGLGVVLITAVAAVILLRGPAKVKVVQQVDTTASVATTTEDTTVTTTTESGGGASLFKPIATTTEEKVVTTVPVEDLTLVQGTDTDADGLTEKEEAIFQTNSKRPDTDSDGFLDGNEVFNLYNPSAVAPVDLVASGIVKLYRNASEGYSIFYPSLWSTSSTSDTSMISFLSDDTESINVTTVKTIASISLRSWYASEYPKLEVNDLQSYTSKGGHQGLQDSDRLNTYIKKGAKVFIINYSLGGTNKVWYRRLYDMMLNSLKID